MWIKISKHWKLQTNPLAPIELCRRDTPVDSEITNPSDRPRAKVVRSVMFANCDKFSRCPRSSCSGNLGWNDTESWRFCNECDTLILPPSWKWINPEHLTLKVLGMKDDLKIFLQERLIWKFLPENRSVFF